MCILFAYVNSNAKNGEFQIIFASNRDEFYDRPTKRAGFWPDYPNCMGGIDLTEGGTWLGISTRGRIGVLLNISQNGNRDNSKQSRGSLVKDFLTQEPDTDAYLGNIFSEKETYNPFNLLLLEQKSSNKWGVNYYTTVGGKPASGLGDGIVALGNTAMATPYHKVEQGKGVFSDIIQRYGKTDCKEELKSHLIELLADKTQFHPDQQLLAGSPTEELAKQRSARCMNIKQVRYGTRTHTLLLVDSEGRCELSETTLTEPINENNLQWDSQTHHFQLNQ